MKSILLVQPSSAASERIFSLLRNSFEERQKDYIEASLMLQYNIFVICDVLNNR